MGLRFVASPADGGCHSEISNICERRSRNSAPNPWMCFIFTICLRAQHIRRRFGPRSFCRLTTLSFVAEKRHLSFGGIGMPCESFLGFCPFPNTVFAVTKPTGDRAASDSNPLQWRQCRTVLSQIRQSGWLRKRALRNRKRTRDFVRGQSLPSERYRPSHRRLPAIEAEIPECVPCGCRAGRAIWKC